MASQIKYSKTEMESSYKQLQKALYCLIVQNSEVIGIKAENHGTDAKLS